MYVLCTNFYLQHLDHSCQTSQCMFLLLWASQNTTGQVCRTNDQEVEIHLLCD